MKTFITKYTAIIMIAVMFILLIPGISLRLNSEAQNKNVIISLLYNDIRNKLNDDELDQSLNDYKKLGLNTVSVMEEDINAMVARGDLTCIKYNVLNHKYDQQSIDVANFIDENCPDVAFDSYVLLVTKENVKEKLSYWLPRKYTSKDYSFVGTFENIDLYVLYNGRTETWNYALGYDEDKIDDLHNKGFNISLIHKVKNYKVTTYTDDIERIVKKYNVKYFNAKPIVISKDEKEYTKNYERIAEIINENDMTLVVTENPSQLSNQSGFGYDEIFDSVMEGSKKVLRSYENYDDSHSDATKYKYRATQYLNSTLDRNIRFITVTQIAVITSTFTECADLTLKAVKEYKDKIEDCGYTIGKEVTPTNYFENKKLNSAAAAVIMIMCLLIMFNIVTGKKSFRLTITALVLSAVAFGASFLLRDSLLSLYPTVFCIVQSCFAMTVVLFFIKNYKEKLNTILLAVLSVLLLIALLMLGAIVMGTLLSGIAYYINNDIFRGIKLSLVVPVAYTALLYYFMFMNSKINDIINDIKKVLAADIKVYWLLIGGAILYVGSYYILRSGNVNSISQIETLMRNTLTELFPARPRTKEFLIGYPALVLLVYYVKNTKVDLVSWVLAVAAAILAASVTNSFCHVFTDFTFIVSRTFNGLLVGIPVAVFAYIANLALVRIVKAVYKKIVSEMK